VKRQIARLVAQPALIILFILSIGATVRAQQMIGAKAGLVPYARGQVFLDGKSLRIGRGDYIQMKNGQSLSTKQGRAELLLSFGAYLRLGEGGSLRMEQNSLDGTQLTFEQGSALIEVVEKIKANPISIKLSAGVIEIKEPGLYRLDSNPSELRVYEGDALAYNGKNKIKVKESRSIRLDGDFAQSTFDPNVADALHGWAAERSFALFIANPINRNLSSWKPVGLGELKSSSYRMRFYTNAAWVRNWQIQAMKDEAKEEKRQDELIKAQLERAKQEEKIQEDANRKKKLTQQSQ
jgi:hypothetical protein